MAHVHQRSVIHRDIKPANILLDAEGEPLLCDFGLARRINDELLITHAREFAGTIPYMAPEQLEGTEADTRTDIFALGAVLYEMLSGTRAFGGASPASVMAAILEHDPPPLATLQPLTPSGVDRLVRKCLAKEPDARWQSAADIADELRWITEGGSQVGAPIAVRSSRRNRERLVGSPWPS